MHKHFVVLSACLFCVSACIPSDMSLTSMKSAVSSASVKKQAFQTPELSIVKLNQGHTLQSWWAFFNDAQLDLIISSALNLRQKNPTEGAVKKDFSELVTYYTPAEVVTIHELLSTYFEYRFVQAKSDLMRQLLKPYNGGEQISGGQDAGVIKDISADLQRADLMLDGFLDDLSKRSGLLREYLEQSMSANIMMPKANMTPFFASETDVLKRSPFVVAARVEFMHSVSQTMHFEDVDFSYATDEMNALFGINDTVYSNENSHWSVSAGEALRGIDFAPLKGACHCPEAIRVFEGRILDYMMDVERILVSYSHIQKQYSVLKRASEKVEDDVRVLDLSSNESFDVHYTSYKTQLAVLRAEHESLKNLLSLYKTLGVY